MSKSKNVKSAAPVTNANTGAVTVDTTTGADALQGRLSSRTHFIHVVLCEAFKANELLTTAQIVTRAGALMTSAHASYAKLARTAPSHLNTMKTRNYIERVLDTTDGRVKWRLTAHAVEVAKLEGAPVLKKIASSKARRNVKK